MTKIGRGQNNDYFLDSIKLKNFISRYHAEVLGRKNENGKVEFVLTDKGLNGTFINDYRVSKTDKECIWGLLMDNFHYFSIKHCCDYSLESPCHGNNFFIENFRKLSFNYHLIPSSLIRVFNVCMKKAWVLSYPLSTQQRLWSDWADAQADLRLRWAHMPFCWFCDEAAHFLMIAGYGTCRNWISQWPKASFNHIWVRAQQIPDNRPGLSLEFTDRNKFSSIKRSFCHDFRFSYMFYTFKLLPQLKTGRSEPE